MVVYSFIQPSSTLFYFGLISIFSGVLITTKIRKLIMQGNEVAAFAATGALGLILPYQRIIPYHPSMERVIEKIKQIRLW